MRKRPIPGFVFETAWKRYAKLPVSERVTATATSVLDQFHAQYNIEMRKDARAVVCKALRSMIRRTTLRKAYKEVFDWIERADLFKPAKGRIEYADVFPLIYPKMRIKGVENPYSGVKHLSVDEIQDDTPVQYAVPNRLFECRKTILGDATQAVNPYSASTPRSDRGGAEICGARGPQQELPLKLGDHAVRARHLAQPRPDRDGTPRRATADPHPANPCQGPGPHRGRDRGVQRLGPTNLAVIAKTHKQAASLHRDLEEFGVAAHPLDNSSTGFSRGVIICTAHMAKGLEFDRVIIPDADADAGIYHTDMDRNLLYVACTRAMHRLTLVTSGTPSPLLPERALA